MSQGNCPACGSSTFEWSTWCQACGFVFPTASTPGGWQVGRKPLPLPAGTDRPTGLTAALPTEPPPAPVRTTAIPRAPAPAAWGTARDKRTPGIRRQGRGSARTGDRLNRTTAKALLALAIFTLAVPPVAALVVEHSRPDPTPSPPRATIVPGTYWAFPTGPAAGTSTPGDSTPAGWTPALDTTPPSPAPNATRLGKFTEFEDGSYAVGMDIPAGTYRGTDPNGHCTWERSAPSASGLLQMVSNSYLSGSLIVTLEDGDTFVADQCGHWTNDLSRVTQSMKVFGDGTYLVGIDISAGEYFAPDPGYRCSWKRLRSFGGTEADVIESSDRSTLVIAKTDKGILSFGCGSWVRS